MGTIKQGTKTTIKKKCRRISTYMWKKGNKSQNDQKEVKPVSAQNLKSD